MAIPEIIAQAKQIDCVDLISRYVALAKVSGHEWAGECPKCGGHDRLHVKTDGWFCRQCHPIHNTHGWHDAVDFMRWLHGLTFQEATERLTNQPWPERKPHRNQPKAQRIDDRPASWFEEAEATLHQHQLALPESEGADYLRRRGLRPSTWELFGLGYTPAIKHPDTGEMLPAIAIPWYRGGKLTAIRYRFLHPPTRQKITSLPRSKTGGFLFGAQGLPEWMRLPLEGDYRGAEQHCTLLLCEGEINAMSIWQVAHHTNLHVMSVGSQVKKLSAPIVAVAQRYKHVIIWMDEPDNAREARECVPGAHACYSPQGKDANDLLQMGVLGSFLVEQRWLSTRSDEERWGLIFDLWDAANGDGLDGRTAAAYRKICDHMGRPFDLIEALPGVWLTTLQVEMPEVDSALC